jgi:DSF synthase
MNAVSHQHVSGRYQNLVTHYDEATLSTWFSMDSRPRPSFTWPLIHDILKFQENLPREPERLRYLVFASRAKGIFSLGGDLTLFQETIESQDRASLGIYAEDCAAVLYNHLNAPAVTISLLEGDVLGAGLESAIASDVVIAERTVHGGFPEVLFNLVPGHGAYQLVARRTGARQAEEMILGGKMYTAEELHAMGLIDILAEPGAGREAVREFQERHAKHWNAFRAHTMIKRLHMPVTRELLSASSGLWVEAAMRLGQRDLKLMQRLVRAQDRRLSSPASETRPEIATPRRVESPAAMELTAVPAFAA